VFNYEESFREDLASYPPLRGGPSISQLFFTDDVLLLAKASTA
jgi:hypothetical protein